MFPSYSASGSQARGIRSLISAVNKHLGLCLLPISGNLSASQKKSVQTAHEKTVGLSSADMASLVLEIVFPSYLIVRQLIQRCPLTSLNAEKCSISLYVPRFAERGGTTTTGLNRCRDSGILFGRRLFIVSFHDGGHFFFQTSKIRFVMVCEQGSPRRS